MSRANMAVSDDKLLRLMELADEVGLEGDFEPLLKTFHAARDRVLKCGDEAAWRILVHARVSENIPPDQQRQLLVDAQYLHHLLKAVNILAWQDTLGATLCQLNPSAIKGQLGKAWDAIAGDVDYPSHFDGKPPMFRWLRESYKCLTDPQQASVRELMDQANVLGVS